MSYYTEFVLECDPLTFDRLVEYWKKHDWDDCVLCRPDHVWKSIGPDKRYLLYASMNHAPSVSEVDDFLQGRIGVDSKRYMLKARGEDDDQWWDWGTLKSLGYIEYRDYDDEKDEMTPVPLGFKEYEYCDIAVNPMMWEEFTIDYTLDEMPKEVSPELRLLNQIRDSLSNIEDILEDIGSRIR